ncbi:MAG: AAA family ATPase [Acidimicrobiaceae bacterium]|nr:AAA family ATPase [Acidimicrobiaceae bacterium]MCY4279254.1 AAA family ATPase [Acidimicrobiaceae bacterium]MCY4293226.1 AAA family ATPase [Acidimicrobiaceae bacterium]
MHESSFNLSEDRRENAKNLIEDRCILYFPADRFEEPAWLNEEHLINPPSRTHASPYEGHTIRKIIATSTLRNNQDWLYDVVTDRYIFEVQTKNVNLPTDIPDAPISAILLSGYSGAATNAFDQAIQLLRVVMQDPKARFGLEPRPRRSISIFSQDTLKVPNIFQLSSGETSIMNLGLSILRDADLSNLRPSQVSEIRGIVIIDEIDLHLHAIHQHKVLPKLVKMFPKVQFIITTHSPLFVLGMQREFGEDGFSLYQLPESMQISPEEFSEFGRAYSMLRQSEAFKQEMRAEIRKAMKPLVFVEGATDKKYIKRAAELLGHSRTLHNVDIRDGGGASKLHTLWKNITKYPTIMSSQPVLILLDNDTSKPSETYENVRRHTINFIEENPIENGIENLLGKEVLEAAVCANSKFIDIEGEHERTVRGEAEIISAKWSVNKDEKMNLCSWICDNGQPEDFSGFKSVLDTIHQFIATNELSG